jgi:hypothetical protein
MLQSARRLAVLVVLSAAGCGGADRADYLKVFHDQKVALDDMADVLEKVQDAPSMDEARAELRSRAEQYESVARRAKALPPPPADVVRRLEEESFILQKAINRVQEQVRRVQQLPGGEAFLKQFSGNVNAFASMPK